MTISLLGLITILLPFSELLRFPINSLVFVRAIDVLSIVFLGYLIITGKKLKNKPLAIFAAILIISNLANPLNLASLSYLVRTLIYLGIFNYILSNNLKVAKKLDRLFGINLVVFVIVGLFQYFLYPNLRNLLYLGYDPHAYRLFGLFLDPNITGIVLVWAFLYFYQRPIKFRTPLLIAIFMSILLTYSRISWLCFVVAIFMLAINKPKKLYYAYLLIVMSVGILLMPRYFGEGTNIWRTNSIVGKAKSISVSIKTIKAKPIFGIGFNNTHLLKKPHSDEIGNNSLYGLDNSLLTILTTSGILGALAYLYLFRSLYHKQNLEVKILTLTFFIHSLSVNSFFIPSLIWYYLLFRIIQRKQH